MAETHSETSGTPAVVLRQGLPSETIVETARLILRQSPYVEFRRISCEYRQGTLFLQGFVSSYYLKQLAQTILREIDGVQRIENRLEVEDGRCRDR